MPYSFQFSVVRSFSAGSELMSSQLIHALISHNRSLHSVIQSVHRTTRILSKGWDEIW